MTACTATIYTQICSQRHTCELHRRYLEAGSGPVSIVDMPLSAANGCYMYEPAGIREAVRRAEENQQ